jgi:hypothetical protein
MKPTFVAAAFLAFVFAGCSSENAAVANAKAEAEAAKAAQAKAEAELAKIKGEGELGQANLDPALAGDDKVYVLVEIRGTLHHTAKSTFVETKHKIAPRGTEEVNRTWKLDLTDIKVTPQDLKNLHGKRVSVNGKAEMGPVRQFISAKGGVVPFTTFEVRDLVVVSNLKEVKGP